MNRSDIMKKNLSVLQPLDPSLTVKRRNQPTKILKKYWICRYLTRQSLLLEWLSVSYCAFHYNMRTLKFKAQPTNVFFRYRQLNVRELLPASDCCRALFRIMRLLQGRPWTSYLVAWFPNTKPPARQWYSKAERSHRTFD